MEKAANIPLLNPPGEARATADSWHGIQRHSEDSAPRRSTADDIPTISSRCEDEVGDQPQRSADIMPHDAANGDPSIHQYGFETKHVGTQTLSSTERIKEHAGPIINTGEEKAGQQLLRSATEPGGARRKTTHGEVDIRLTRLQRSKTEAGQDDGTRHGDTCVQRMEASDRSTTFGDGMDILHVEQASPTEAPLVKDASIVFEYEPMESSQAEAIGYPKLDFKPFQIRVWFLAITLAFFLTCIAAIVLVMTEAGKHKGSIHVYTSGAHLAYRYVPVALGSITTVWWRTVATTYGRLHPYLIMSAHKDTRDKLQGGAAAVKRTIQAYYPLGIFKPSLIGLLALVLTGRCLLMTCMLIAVLNAVYLMPLKASFVQLTPNGSGWDVVVSPKIGYTLMSTYALLSAVTLTLLATLYNRRTGLKWDPVSIADQLGLIQGSNIWPLFEGLEIADDKVYMQVLKERGHLFGSLRLGYWKHGRDGSIWHGMAFAPGTATAEQHASHRAKPCKGKEKCHHDTDITAAISDTHPTIDGIDHEIALARHRSVLGMVCDPFLALYALGTLSALGFMAAELFAGRLQRGIQLHSVRPTSPTRESPNKQFNSHIFSTKESFLFSFLPVFFMNCFSFLWSNADNFYRHMTPFAEMNVPAPASSTVLLDYPTCMPLGVSVKAALNHHWRVSLFSLLSLTGPIPPIIASSIFTGTGNSTGAVVRLQPANFWITFGILIFYLFCIAFARPSTAYRLPRCIWDVAELALFCYKSRIWEDKLLGTPVFSAQDPTDTRIHMESRIHLAKQEYLFGMYLGSDGKRHMGFDVSQRQYSSGQVVVVNTFDPGKGLYFTPWGYRYYFRYPRARASAE